MGKRIFTIIIFLSVFLTVQVLYAEKHEMDSTRYCPVSKERLEGDTGYTYEYKGKTYYFCCPECIEEFKKDPDKYTKDDNTDTKMHKHHGHCP